MQSTNTRYALGHILSKFFSVSAYILAGITPSIVIYYLITFDGATMRFHHHLIHEFAIFIAVATSAFIGWVAYLNYRGSGENFQFWAALAYFGFALVYTPHGILTRMADTHLPVFLVFGPASRLAMGLYLLVAVLCFNRPDVSGRRLLPHFFALMMLVAALAGAGFAGWIGIPQVRAMEMISNGVFTLTLLVMLIRWTSVHLLAYQRFALLWFIQASAAFLLSKPWSHLWWLAHLLSAAGFVVLGCAIMRAHQTTAAFSQVFSLQQLHHRLLEHAAQLEREKQEQTMLINELHISSQKLADSNQALEQFTSMVSHDLKAPLHTINGFVEILRQDLHGRIDSKTDEVLNHITKGVLRMRTLINGLLSYARSSHKELCLVQVSLDSLMAEVVSDLRQTIEDTQASVTWNNLPTITADFTLLRSAVQNLIVNAIKYRGERPPVIHVSAQRDGAFWTLSVCDNGIGLAPEDTSRTFRAFQRINVIEDCDGCGIGLAVVERSAERHGGRAWAESVGIGRGACFYFTLSTDITNEEDSITPTASKS